jgi:hypothetical protein
MENQIYAHFPNVEIRIVEDYLKDDFAGFVGKVNLLTPYFNPIKIYTDFKEKTEKDNIDPFSSLTSALTKSGKQGIRFFQVNFSPIPDRVWKNDELIRILSSKYPKFLKKFMLTKWYKYLKYLMLPFSLVMSFI